MPSTVDVINQLTKARNALAAHTANLSPNAGQYLWTAIDDINDEIDQQMANGLANADYIPQSDPFKSATAQGQQFLGTLNDIKSFFGGAQDVLNAVTSVVGLILKL